MRVKKDRTADILALLQESGTEDVSSLADKLGISQVTLRKDLDGLEARGILTRSHGKAQLGPIEHVGTRLAFHYEQKREIAKAAAALIADRETVIIENGSCCTLLAEELANTRKDITILTNSVFLAERIGENRNATVVLLGGTYQPVSKVLTGPLVQASAAQYKVDKFFGGTDGYIPQKGMGNWNRERAEAAANMADRAKRVFLLTESDKFDREVKEPFSFHVDCIITDSKIREDTRKELEALETEVINV